MTLTCPVAVAEDTSPAGQLRVPGRQAPAGQADESRAGPSPPHALPPLPRRRGVTCHGGTRGTPRGASPPRGSPGAATRLTSGWTRPSRLCTTPHVAMPMVTTSPSSWPLLRLESRTALPTCFITPVWDPPVTIQAPAERSRGRGGRGSWRAPCRAHAGALCTLASHAFPQGPHPWCVQRHGHDGSEQRPRPREAATQSPGPQAQAGAREPPAACRLARLANTVSQTFL